MYLSYDDLLTGINSESLNVITRNRDNAEQAIREAVAEVKSYLSVRYDIDNELMKSGSDRDPMVFRMVRDIALYRCYAISNPSSMPEIRRRNYEDTISLLKSIQSEKAALPCLKRLDGDNGGSNYVKYGGNTKRKNKWL